MKFAQNTRFVKQYNYNTRYYMKKDITEKKIRENIFQGVVTNPLRVVPLAHHAIICIFFLQNLKFPY